MYRPVYVCIGIRIYYKINNTSRFAFYSLRMCACAHTDTHTHTNEQKNIHTISKLFPEPIIISDYKVVPLTT